MERQNTTKESLKDLFKSFDLSKMSCLDMFGNDGHLQTEYFFENCKSIDIWEIEQKYVSILRRKFTTANVECLDSVKKIIELKSEEKKYDLVVIDSPLMSYCNDMYCEHFEILPNLNKVFSDECLVLINIVSNPYDVDNPKNTVWLEKRKSYYGSLIDSNHRLSLDRVGQFYTQKFMEYGMNATMLGLNCRESIDNVGYFYHGLFLLENRQK